MTPVDSFASKLRLLPRGPVIAVLMLVLMLVLPRVFGGTIHSSNYLDIISNFATLAPLAIAIGLTMILAEFDISTVSTFTLGGVIALKLGDSAGLLVGIVAAAAAGALLGVIQGGIVSRLNISSVPITLAGFLMIWGIAEIVAGGEGEQVVSQNFERGEKLLKPVLTIFTISSLIVIGCVIVLHLVLAYTRLGRNLRAVGGDRRASRISGIRVPFVIIGTFAAAGVVAALGGALQAVSFSSVSPDVSFNPLLFAVIAAIIGGVGITGAHGSPLGIACGVLAFETLEETFVILKLDPNVATVLTGAFLLAIAIISAPDLRLPSKWRTTNLPAALSRRSKESALDPSGS